MRITVIKSSWVYESYQNSNGRFVDSNLVPRARFSFGQHQERDPSMILTWRWVYCRAKATNPQTDQQQTSMFRYMLRFMWYNMLHITLHVTQHVTCCVTCNVLVHVPLYFLPFSQDFQRSTPNFQIRTRLLDAHFKKCPKTFKIFYGNVALQINVAVHKKKNIKISYCFTTL